MLVLAAPHSKCNGPERDCDKDAREIVLSLLKKARGKKINAVGCLANEMRSKVDNNRDGSENSQFRRELDAILRKEDGLFIEIHSHPNVPRFKGKKMTIFNLANNKDLAVELYKFLDDPDVGIQQGEDVMSIQKKYRGLMLEFNEGKNHDELLNKIISYVQSKTPIRMFGGKISMGICKIALVLCIIILIVVMLFILMEICQCAKKKKVAW